MRREGRAQAEHVCFGLYCGALALQTVLDLRLLSKECVAEAAAEAERQRDHGESIFSLDLLSVRGESGPSSSAQAAGLLMCGTHAGFASYAVLPQLASRCVPRIAMRRAVAWCLLCPDG